MTDYPYAERNLMIRLSELTKTHISLDNRHDPNSWVVRATDPQLFNCPYLGRGCRYDWHQPPEAVRLREYLLKGGFCGRLLGHRCLGAVVDRNCQGPASDRYPILDGPLDPIFRSQFIVSNVPQITNIQFWRHIRVTTSERGDDSAERTSGPFGTITPHHGVDDAQHRRGGLVGTRRGGPGVFSFSSPNGYAPWHRRCCTPCRISVQ
jgi:hypothetical protein